MSSEDGIMHVRPAKVFGSPELDKFADEWIKQKFSKKAKNQKEGSSE